MKVLCIIPPYLPSYFNAGHHLHIFSVAAYLRKNIKDIDITCCDGAALNITWKEVCDLLIQQFELIILLNDFDGIDTFDRFMRYKKNFSPNSKVVTFGRLSKQIPRFFFKFGIDAVAFHGDYENSIENYIHYMKGGIKLPSGVLLSHKDEERRENYLSAEEWVLPDVTEIPYASYNFMYRNDLNKFCGIPARQELVIPLARGCPYNCHFCDVPFMQGLKERRLSVDRVIDYVTDSFNKVPFEYFTFYAPTFTLKKKWVSEFCSKMTKLPQRYPWKCITVLSCLDHEQVQQMAEAGCVRISLGIESFTHNAAMKLPKIKHDILGQFIEMVTTCKKYGVELNCFIVLGLPGDTPQNVKHTIDTCLQYGARIRPTIYTPYDNLREDMSVLEVSDYNRQYFPPGYLDHEVALEYYKLFYALKGDTSTMVMKNIPSRQKVLAEIA